MHHTQKANIWYHLSSYLLTKKMVTLKKHIMDENKTSQIW